MCEVNSENPRLLGCWLVERRPGVAACRKPLSILIDAIHSPQSKGGSVFWKWKARELAVTRLRSLHYQRFSQFGTWSFGGRRLMPQGPSIPAATAAAVDASGPGSRDRSRREARAPPQRSSNQTFRTTRQTNTRCWYIGASERGCRLTKRMHIHTTTGVVQRRRRWPGRSSSSPQADKELQGARAP